MRRVVALLVLIVGCSDGSVAFDGSAGGSLAASSGSTSSSGAAGTPSTGGFTATGGTVATGGAATGGSARTGGSTPTGGTSTAGALARGGTSGASGTVEAAGTAGSAECLPNFEPAPIGCQWRGENLAPCAGQPCGHTLCLVESNDPMYLGFCRTAEFCTFLKGELLSPGLCMVN